MLLMVLWFYALASSGILIFFMKYAICYVVITDGASEVLLMYTSLITVSIIIVVQQ